MRKTITAVARDAAIWREHKRRQRSGEQDETRLEGVSPPASMTVSGMISVIPMKQS